MRLLIVGDGGYGRLVAELAELVGWNEIDFIDDSSPLAIGKILELDNVQEQYDGIIIAIGNPDTRKKIAQKAKKLISLIHPTAVVSKSAVIEPGCVLEANAVVSTGVRVGGCSFICAVAVVNHDASVGSFCQVDCNAVVSCGAVLNDGIKVESSTVYKGEPSRAVGEGSFF